MIDVAYKYGYESPESFFTVSWHNAPTGKTKRHKENQRLLAMVKSFPNEIINDDNNHSIPDFWTVCSEKGLIEPMKLLRDEGKRNCR